jgi:hypothetical protein
MSKRGSIPRTMRQQFAAMRNRIVRIARRTLGAFATTLIMLCQRWGGPASRRAARAFAKSIRSTRPAPLRWRRLDPILAALTAGASESTQAHLRDLVSEQEDLSAMARLLGELLINQGKVDHVLTVVVAGMLGDDIARRSRSTLRRRIRSSRRGRGISAWRLRYCASSQALKCPPREAKARQRRRSAASSRPVPRRPCRCPCRCVGGEAPSAAAALSSSPHARLEGLQKKIARIVSGLPRMSLPPVEEPFK